MPLPVGSKLGPYEILAPIGAGGMGEVYRARDTRLDRIVAVKVSKTEFSERFEREARAIATLNHPHICQLYDVVLSKDAPNYLVMEYIEGQPLKGPLPLDQTLKYAAQICDALEAAHRKNIIHRDLKPANILVTKTGVKLLDFGLAKMGTPGPALQAGEGTMTMALTGKGEILGTFQYMSPEQINGQDASPESDIFSFGLVLYEMLTGKRAFDGSTPASVIAAILERPAPSVAEVAPPALDRVLKRCLEKDPESRWHSARDLKHTLELITTETPKPVAPALAPAPARKTWLWLAVAAGVIVAGASLVFWAPWRKSAPTQAVRFEVGPADKMRFISQAAMAVSPDGRWMVFPARGEDGVQHYYLRSLDGVDIRALPGADGGQAPPSWSYDSRWVIFATGSKLKKVDIQGGPPQTITDTPITRLGGAAWNSAGVIIVGTDGSPILRVPASGGQTTPATALAPGENAHRWPQFLPDGKHFLYLRVSSDAAKTGVYIGSLDGQPNQQNMQRLLATDRQAYYAPAPGGTGYLIFLRGATLMAQPFDPSKMTLSGEPAAIADGVDSFTTTNHGLFSVSDTGTLVYRGGSGARNVLTWFDQQGNPTGTLGDPGDYSLPAISPDGSRVAVAMGPAQSRDIWILDVARGSSTRFTFDPARDDYPAWSPDGNNIAFSSDRGGQMDLYIKPADGSGEEKLLLKTDEPKSVERWTKDGRFLLFTSTGRKTAGDIWALPFPGEAKPVLLLQTKFPETYARVSPDGRWLAYASTESGVNEIYVRPFTPQAAAGTGARWLVSKGGGLRPIWRQDGKELFYLSVVSQVMAVDIDTGKGFQAGTPRRMFDAPAGATTTGWDLSPDGKRFLFAAPPNSGQVIPFTVIVNWAAELKK